MPTFMTHKRPGEELPFTVDWTGFITNNFPGEVLQAGTVITIQDNASKADVTAAMLVTTTIASTKLIGVIKGGVIGKTYYCLFRGITQAAYKIEDVILLTIIR